MATIVGTGASEKHITKTAIAEAMQAARSRLGRAKPNFGFLFAGPDHDLGAALTTARELAGCRIRRELHGG